MNVFGKITYEWLRQLNTIKAHFFADVPRLLCMTED